MPDPILYVVGENMPGYMPDSEPCGPYPWTEAVDVLVSDMRSFADELAENADPDPTYDAALAERIHTLLWDGLGYDVNEPEDYPAERERGFEVIFEDRCFFILPDAG